MIVFVPAREDSDKSLVSEQLGRANYFYVYDTSTKKEAIYENRFKRENHGAGIKTAEFILKQNTDCLITPRVGEKSLELLLDSDVKIYKSNGKIIKENIHDLLNDALEELY
jgi:predicted Fe-Mo cluster-binding NifX family protein